MNLVKMPAIYVVVMFVREISLYRLTREYVLKSVLISEGKLNTPNINTHLIILYFAVFSTSAAEVNELVVANKPLSAQNRREIHSKIFHTAMVECHGKNCRESPRKRFLRFT